MLLSRGWLQQPGQFGACRNGGGWTRRWGPTASVGLNMLLPAENQWRGFPGSSVGSRGPLVFLI